VAILDRSARPSDDATRYPHEVSQEELIIKEARRRQRRRWLALGFASLIVATVVAVVLALLSGRSPSRSRPNVAPTTPTIAAVSACTSSQLKVTVGFVQGTSEQWLIPLTFTNVSAGSCSVSGYPALSLVNAAGQSVGLPVKQQGEQGAGSPRPITLISGASALASLWQPDTTDMVSAGQSCSPVSWGAIRVTFPAAAIVAGSDGDWSQTTSTCSTGSAAAWVGPLLVPPA
jgi:hypothetical protein